MNSLFIAAVLAAKVVTLQDALTTAEKNQPAQRAIEATATISQSRADEARASLLPQVTLSADFTRASQNSFNFVTGKPDRSWVLFNSTGATLRGTQVLLDLGLYARWKSAQATARAAHYSTEESRNGLRSSVRIAYFVARAKKELLTVAQDARENQEKHLKTVQGFVTVGRNPEIDLAQARGSAANARFAELRASADYNTSLEELQQTMGQQGPADFDVADEAIPAVDGEDESFDALVTIADRSRPELIGSIASVEASRVALEATRAAYLPQIVADGRATSAGPDTNRQAENIQFSVGLTWNLFNGLLTTSQVRESKASLALAEANHDELLLQARLELDVARRAVILAKAEQVSAEEALVAANERLRLAEGRYAAGAGTIIELDDAQLARNQAAAQRVQADFDLYSARAQLLQALGRS